MATPMDVITPPIGDGSGFQLRHKDLQCLGLNLDGVSACRDRQRPLGMAPSEYTSFVADLQKAADDDDLTGFPLDVRLQGSSVRFFSSPYKPLPTAREQIFDVYVKERGFVPLASKLDDIEQRLRDWWINDGHIPSRRPFDSLFRLDISPDPSDYDLQISSAEIERRCKDLLGDLGVPSTPLRIANPEYAFLNKHLVQKVCPNLWLFTLRYSDWLHRHVSIAAFGVTGPPQLAGDPERSSHFRSKDWIIVLRGCGPPGTASQP